MKKNIYKFLAFSVILMLVLGATLNVGAISIESETDCTYKDVVLPLIFKDSPFLDDNLVIYYEEEYEYYSPESIASDDEATPDYVLVSVSTNLYGENEHAVVYGDYVVRNNDHSEIPYSSGYGVYIPAENKVYPLSEACRLDIDGIGNVFIEAGVGELIGDMDKDRMLTVKDATYIQKCLAEMIEYGDDEILAYRYYSDPPLRYISDFNRDGVRNIKDATAIQKHIAGIEY